MNNIGKKTGNEIKMYGHYYTLFKRDCGIPSRITVVGIDGGNATVVHGHLAEEESKNCKIKMNCSQKKILTELTDEQKNHIKMRDLEENNPENEIKMYGHYYKLFTGRCGIPSEITVIGINGADITFVNGHLAEEECKSALIKKTCHKRAIITKLNTRQKKGIELEKMEIRKREELVNKIWEEFGIRIPLLTWGSVKLDELEEYYEELKENQ